MDACNSFDLQPLKCAFDGQIGWDQSSEGKDDDPETHVPRFIYGNQRTVTILNDVQQQRPWREILYCPARFVFALEAFQQTDVCAKILSSAQSDEAFVIPVLLVRVSSCNQDDIRACFVFGCFGGSDA